MNDTPATVQTRATDPVSRRHREWGQNALATDIDLILIEWGYELGIVALIEYKLGADRAVPDDEGHAVTKLGELGARADVPAYLVKYSSSPWRFRVYPLNEIGSGTMPFARGELVTELRFVDFLYRLRGIDMPKRLRTVLDDHLEGA